MHVVIDTAVMVLQNVQNGDENEMIQRSKYWRAMIVLVQLLFLSVIPPMLANHHCSLKVRIQNILLGRVQPILNFAWTKRIHMKRLRPFPRECVRFRIVDRSYLSITGSDDANSIDYRTVITASSSESGRRT
jgi:hypothetical protein